MTSRWRGRAGLVLAAALLAGAAAASVQGSAEQAAVVVTGDDGRILARLPLSGRGEFALRYRNSLYGTWAEERFVAEADGFRLRELAAEQLAVLEEYYAVDEAPLPAESGWWTAAPPYELRLDDLRIAATDLGQRTLLVAGEKPIDLWRLVEDAAPSVVVSLEGAP